MVLLVKFKNNIDNVLFMKREKPFFLLALGLLFLGILFMAGYGSEIIGVSGWALNPLLNQLFIAGFVFISLSIFILGVLDYE